ncbi:hypothetical protein DPEC_G00024160 [Dallia pectoralis]|uniref:Uncharacterized protein n=1 Tax=Dallia pectoralis TaxID=75939 RepID=A0ACC2HIF8_DALPE|nr:hypothetical protein DPEC_G00024160 [Dallia pectoralis]
MTFRSEATLTVWLTGSGRQRANCHSGHIKDTGEGGEANKSVAIADPGSQTDLGLHGFVVCLVYSVYISDPPFELHSSVSGPGPPHMVFHIAGIPQTLPSSLP